MHSTIAISHEPAHVNPHGGASYNHYHSINRIIHARRFYSVCVHTCCACTVRCLFYVASFQRPYSKAKINSLASSLHYSFWLTNGTLRATDEHQCYLFPPVLALDAERMCSTAVMSPRVKAPALDYYMKCCDTSCNSIVFAMRYVWMISEYNTS